MILKSKKTFGKNYQKIWFEKEEARIHVEKEA